MADNNVYEESSSAELAQEVFSGKLNVRDALERLRTRLLDLTMRNKLLNYRPPKGRAYQFVGEPDLNLVYDRLEEGKSVPLAYVPDPPHDRYEGSKKPQGSVYAKELGIATTVDLPVSAEATSYRRVGSLQVLLYPTDLEKASRKIASEAHTVIDETGTNMLYLMFGFLEYYDSEDSDKAVLAPLLSMPVHLNRGLLDQDSRTYLYELSHSGEDVAENFTLREKLRQQFRLELPALDEEDSPEAYLEKISQAVSKRKRWAVRRRLTLGFLSFGKLAIWADLDPDKSDALLSSELLRNIFEGGRGSDEGGFHAEDYVIDTHADAEMPLIYDADSSQHSAIIDVKNGKNLVINGPPGTGKSQTITNIIATAIASKKKVLFVSEKLAALEVVKQRLERAGLGDFCLELHSHKTQKKQLLDNIDKRINRKFSAPHGYSERVKVLRERRDALNTYSELLGSRIGNNLGYTVHKVFWVTERCRQALAHTADTVAPVRISKAENWSAEQYDKCLRALSEVTSSLAELGCTPPESAWLGFFPPLLIRGDELPILDAASQAKNAIAVVDQRAGELNQLLGGSAWTVEQLKDGATVAPGLMDVPAPLNESLLARMHPNGLSDLQGTAQLVASFFSRLDEIAQHRERGLLALTTLDVLDKAQFDAVLARGQAAIAATTAQMPVHEFEGAGSILQEALSALRSACGARAVTLPRDLDSVRLLVDQHLGMETLAQLVNTPASSLSEEGEKVESVAREVRRELDQVSDILRAGRIPFDGKTDELQVLLDGRGLPELLPDVVIEQSAISELRALAAGGWEDWTAEQFSAKAREITELLATARTAIEELQSVMGRATVPFDATKAALGDVETLLAISEGAPMELLAYRTPAMERPDFAEQAIAAEERHKSIASRVTKLTGVFHMDTLPDDDELKRHVQVFRRGDSIFNFFRSDWRAAKRAFVGCSKDARKLPAREMGERMAAVISWRAAQTEYSDDSALKSAFGSLFQGVKTDYSRVRRLHEWMRMSSPKLLSSNFAGQVTMQSIQQPHVELLAASAPKVRSWVGSLQQVFRSVSTVPGLDPALATARRIDEIIGPLTEYARAMAGNAVLLKKHVKPTASVSRAVELVDLKRRLAANDELLRTLLTAPHRLADVAGGLALPSSSLSYQDLRASLNLVDARVNAAKSAADVLRQGLGSEETLVTAKDVLSCLTRVSQLSTPLLASGRFGPNSTLADVADAKQAQLTGARSLFDAVKPFAKQGSRLQDVVRSIGFAHSHRQALSDLSSDEALQSYFGESLRGEATKRDEISVCLVWATKVGELSRDMAPGSCSAFVREGAADAAMRAAGLLTEASHFLEQYETSMKKLAAKGQLDWKVWNRGQMPSDALRKLEGALNRSSELVPWSKYLAAKDDAEEMYAGDLVQLVEDGRLDPKSLRDAFAYAFHRTVSKGILASHRELARFTGAGHEQLRGAFAELDKELIELNGAMYAAKVDAGKKVDPGISTGRAGDLTEMALLAKETKKQKRHIPIRQLMKRAGRTLQQIKPCFMMGPLSVAQYLEPGKLSFDLIVMDEASQLRPEDALGAIARGKQLVVVGDPKQLPPTNFFDRLMDDDEEDADETPAVADGVESVLGICEHLYRPVRTLRWHYRSKHESLIAFSNSQFYDGRLVVFPSPYKRNKRLGVNYRYVHEGKYQDRRNIPEAQRVVNAVVEHMMTCPEESLGVVTLNQTQRELIEDMLDKRLREVPAAAKYLERHEQEGWKFFVKNLENVQGDERDVIFVSTTFGRPPDGSPVRQGFGPINRPDGWRRLNVLFTRARRRLDLFSSMLPTDVRLEGKTSAGRRALRDYLEFARSGTLPGAEVRKSGRDADSDFELAVAATLSENGYVTEPQVGVAGYFIDLGVRHPGRPGEFLAGIECDGATYHSSLSARDRDRIRQEVLESLGWRGRLIRVWSTDWFSDPKAQTARLLRFLETRVAEDKDSPAPYVDEVLELDPVLALPPAEEPAPGLPEVALNAPTAAPSASPTLEVVSPVDLFVEVGDRVTYEVVGMETERKTVQIIDSPSNLRMGLLNELTPLAQALIGLCVGDETTLAVGGNAAHQLRVVKIVRL